ncbi:Ribosomal protein S6 kinase [Operophtera brumata]|uniref:Ribosomal protein S6 kinase n=1 Tax=Operophtera brumata TaxID=104452 RepID=A0A0L7L7J9_OPEBR|nr:Ribosomal protein S6 kinase [Operophtera brumata]
MDLQGFREKGGHYSSDLARADLYEEMYEHMYAVDWWSVGVLTYELLTGASPFTVEGEKNTQQEITKRIVRCSYPVPPDVSPEVQDFIRKLLVCGPEHTVLREYHIGSDLDAEHYGSYSVCRKCIHKQTGKEYAVKACQGCPYIITLHEVFHDSAFTYIVTELASGGELLGGCARPLPEPTARRLLSQLAKAVQHMHARQVVVSRARSTTAPGYGPQCDLWSLGVIYPASRKEPVTAFMDRIRAGNFTMEAPEVVSRARSTTAPGYGPQCDLWSLGVIYASRRLTIAELLAALDVHQDEDSSFRLAVSTTRVTRTEPDMTKAELYKRRNKNKPRRSSSEPGTSSEDKDMTLIETITNLKNRMNKNSIENDLELIKANTKDTPVNETAEPNYELDEVPSVKPVEKTYAKSRSKLDDYMYVESSQGLDDTEVAFPKSNRGKKSTAKEQTSPAPKKRRVEPKKETPKVDKKITGRTLRSKFTCVEQKPAAEAKGTGTKRSLRNATEKNTRATKESIENEIKTRTTRKRKFVETNTPVLREKGQNGRNSAKSIENERKIVRAKKTKVEKPKVEAKVAKTKVEKAKVEKTKVEKAKSVMTRSLRHRLEISLSASEAKELLDLSFESDRRVDSIESGKSNKSAKSTKSNKSTKNTKVKTAKAKITSKAKNDSKGKVNVNKGKVNGNKGKVNASKANVNASKVTVNASKIKKVPVRVTRSRR